MMSVSRGAVKHGAQAIKYLLVSFLPETLHDEEKEFVLRLPNGDRRRCRAKMGMQRYHEWFAALPIGVWCQIDYPSAEGKDG